MHIAIHIYTLYIIYYIALFLKNKCYWEVFFVKFKDAGFFFSLPDFNLRVLYSLQSKVAAKPHQVHETQAVENSPVFFSKHVSIKSLQQNKNKTAFMWENWALPSRHFTSCRLLRQHSSAGAKLPLTQSCIATFCTTASNKAGVALATSCTLRQFFSFSFFLLLGCITGRRDGPRAAIWLHFSQVNEELRIRRSWNVAKGCDG